MSFQTELLSPAGDFSILKAVTAAGADAVYVGGDRFGARAYATNFSTPELLEALDYVHVRGKKLYLTINTLLKNREIEQSLYEYVKPFYEHGLDGVIVQDFGVLSFLKRNFDELPLHASTQMSVCSPYGASFLKQQGVCRIVTARELSLPEIKAIYDETGMEIESFVHGALCYSYSGMCLMSSMLGGRSGNRGRCAGTCRLPMSVTTEKSQANASMAKSQASMRISKNQADMRMAKNQVDIRAEQKQCYPLSLKDLCTVSLLPELIEHGICSFKIEGRMKSAQYAAGVTEIYRKYLDLYLEKGVSAYQVEKKDIQTLLDLGNRSGFTDGYYKRHNGKEMVSFEKPNHSHDKDAFKEADKEGALRREYKVPIYGEAVFTEGEPMRLTVHAKDTNVTVIGEICESAKNAPAKEEDLKNRLQKTNDTAFFFTSLSVTINGEVFAPVKQVNELRRNALEKLQEELLKSYVRKAKPEVPNSLAYEEKQHISNSFSCVERTQLFVLVSNSTQLQAMDALREQTCIYLESHLFTSKEDDLFQTVKGLQALGHEVGIALPYVLREKSISQLKQLMPTFLQIGVSDFLARNYDTLGFLQAQGVAKEKITCDERIYAFSNEAQADFASAGYSNLTVPLELNEKEIAHLNDRLAQMILYGRFPLMITANCIHKNFYKCDHASSVEKLTDRYQKEFPVLAVCKDCYNLILNADCMNLTGKKKNLEAMGYHNFRLQFSVESPQEVRDVINAYYDLKRLSGTYTNGHFKRGVE